MCEDNVSCVFCFLFWPTLLTVCQKNHFECVEWFLTDETIKKQVNIDLQSKQGASPLIMACQNGSEEAVALLCELCANLKILDLEADIGGIKLNAIDFAVMNGHTSIFSKLVITELKRNNINSMESLNNTKKGILTTEMMNKWLNFCEQRNNTGLHSFLLKLIENGIKQNNFGLIMSLLESASVNFYYNNESFDNDNIQQLYKEIRKDQFIANYLFSHLKKETLIDVSQTVLHGLKQNECGFNDSLLFLTKLINTDEFNQTLKYVCNNCLNTEKTNDKKHHFFKNNLLNSNIWSLTNDTNTNNDDGDIKTNDDISDNGLFYVLVLLFCCSFVLF